MTKAEFVLLLHQRLDDKTLTKTQLTKITDTIFALIPEMAIEYGEKLNFRPFGTFFAKDYAKRPARNPMTQEPVEAPGRTKLFYKPGAAGVKKYE